MLYTFPSTFKGIIHMHYLIDLPWQVGKEGPPPGPPSGSRSRGALPSEPPAARSADPRRARALPDGFGPRQGARGRPRPPPSSPAAAATSSLSRSSLRRAARRRRHRRADPASRPAGPRRGGGSARALAARGQHCLPPLKGAAPSPPPPPRPRVWFFGACLCERLSRGAWGMEGAGLDLGRSLTSAFTF